MGERFPIGILKMCTQTWASEMVPQFWDLGTRYAADVRLDKVD